MPNLVGLRDASPTLSMEDQAKRDTMNAMQWEALGIGRRDHLSTTDFKENRFSYVSTVHLQSQRLVNKSSIGEGERSKLQGWNNAWTRLQDDDTDSRNLRDVNEGLGQTHRAKLMSDDSIRVYTGESNFRGGGRGGRGGGRAQGERRVMFQNTPLVQPVTRVRIPKGQPTARIDAPPRQPAPILKTVSAVKPAKGNITIRSVPAPSTRRPVIRYDGVLAAPSAFMASIGTRNEQARDEPSVEIVPSTTNTPEEQEAAHNTGTSFTKTPSTPSIPSDELMAYKPNASTTDTPNDKPTSAAAKPTVSLNSRPKADLMDLDIGQETTQPVLQFTAPSTEEQPSHSVVRPSPSFDQQIEALERSGVLSATQLEVLKAIQTQVHAREEGTTLVTEAPRHGTYTTSNLVSLRPTTAAPKVTTGIARTFAEQQNAFLIGEHVHKTRFHPAASLTEDLKKLSISDKKPAKPVATITEKSTINPFGPPPAKSRGPTLPPHLLNQNTTTDHGAAARAQYSGGNDILASISNAQSPGGITSTRPTRRNMINETGFIALAEKRNNSGAAGKKGEDPLLVARKRGL